MMPEERPLHYLRGDIEIMHILWSRRSDVTRKTLVTALTQLRGHEEYAEKSMGFVIAWALRNLAEAGFVTVQDRTISLTAKGHEFCQKNFEYGRALIEHEVLKARNIDLWQANKKKSA
jgi:predicted transcriptional regulator